jgi:hypothetical protein
MRFEPLDRCPTRDSGVGGERTEILGAIPRHLEHRESWEFRQKLGLEPRLH